MENTNTIIEILEGADAGAHLDLEDFLSENEFEEFEIDEIRATLTSGQTYTGGGGAAPLWSIRVATQRTTIKIAMIAEVNATTDDEAQRILDAFREAVQPNSYGVSLYRVESQREENNNATSNTNL